MRPTLPLHMRGALAALGVSGLLAAAVGFLPRVDQRVALYVVWSLPIVSLSLLLALACAVAAWRERAAAARAWRDRRADVACIVALALLVALLAYLVPARMRIQADEYMIGGVALGIWHGGAPLLPSSGFYTPTGILVPESLALDKRGVLVPLLIATMHHGRGFDPTNAFTLNLAVGFLALCAVFAFVRSHAGPSTALLAAFLLAAHPAFAWAIRSVSLEPLNLALLAASAALAVRALARPTAWRALLLAWLAPLFAQARYESVVFALLSLALALVVLSRSRPARLHLALLAVVPLAFLPYAWQRAAAFAHGLESIGASRAFGLDYLVEHLPALALLYLRPSVDNPLGPMVLLTGGAWLALALVRRAAPAGIASRDERLVAIAYGGAIVVVTAIVLAYAWGDLRSEVVLRLGLPLMLLGAVVAAFAVRALAGKLRRPAAVELACAAAAIGLALPAIASDAGYARMDLGPALNEALRWKAQRHPHCRFVFVGAATPYFLQHGEHAVTIGEIERDWPMIEDRVTRNGADSLVLVQVGDARRGVPLAMFGEPRGMRVDTLFERDVNSIARLRLAVLRHPARALPDSPRRDCGPDALAAGARAGPGHDAR